jgi:triosephosphate isomerase
MKKLLFANWKMNLPDLAGWRRDWKSKKADIVIAPPFPFILEVGKLISGASLGAQNVFWKNPPAGEGAYTGEVSPRMLKAAGVKYVILGHSERRRILGETDEIINKKVLAALETGLKIILCVGEPLEVRKKGIKAVKSYLKKQISVDLRRFKNLRSPKLFVAYEPIWAIGTGRVDKPEDVALVARFIKSLIDSKLKIKNVKLLYGGSVDSQNSKNFLKLKEVDGALVGHASLKASEFLKIIKSIS